MESTGFDFKKFIVEMQTFAFQNSRKKQKKFSLKRKNLRDKARMFKQQFVPPPQESAPNVSFESEEVHHHDESNCLINTEDDDDEERVITCKNCLLIISKSLIDSCKKKQRTVELCSECMFDKLKKDTSLKRDYETFINTKTNNPFVQAFGVIVQDTLRGKDYQESLKLIRDISSKSFPMKKKLTKAQCDSLTGLLVKSILVSNPSMKVSHLANGFKAVGGENVSNNRLSYCLALVHLMQGGYPYVICDKSARKYRKLAGIARDLPIDPSFTLEDLSSHILRLPKKFL